MLVNSAFTQDRSTTTRLLAAREGSELLLGIAGGFRIQAFTLGVELYEATAFQAFMAAGATAREALASGRFESLTADGRMLRIKLGAGAGIAPVFGAPEWRTVVAIELTKQASERKIELSLFSDGVIKCQ